MVFFDYGIEFQEQIYLIQIISGILIFGLGSLLTYLNFKSEKKDSIKIQQANVAQYFLFIFMAFIYEVGMEFRSFGDI